MSQTRALNIPPHGIKAPPADMSEGDTMFDPKWGVLAVALGSFALAAGYNAQLGLAVGAGIVILVAIYLWIQLRFAFAPGQSPADRSVLAQRFSRLGRNRRVAQAADKSGLPKPIPPRDEG